jgi:HD-GYP domain-containing protein (c-di-GMP phosphodiesterase class II)
LSEAHLRNYVAVLFALAITLIASWVYWYGFELDYRYAVGAGIFAALFALSEIFSIKISDHIELSASDIALALSVIVLGPTWAAIAALPYALFVGKRNALRTAYEASQNTIGIFLAAIVFYLVSEPLLTGGSQSFAATVYASLVVTIILLANNFVATAGLLKIKYDQPVKETWKQEIEPYLFSDGLSVLTVGVAVLALLNYGPAAALVVAVGAIGSQALVLRSREQVRRIGELEERVESLEESLAASSLLFGNITIRELGRRDGYTHQHAVATAVYAGDIAREMGLDEDRLEKLQLAALLHNIGLSDVPEDLLNSQGRLNSIAWEKIRNHPIEGEKTLAAVPEFGEISTWIRWHHERPDGRGYPDKLRGAWIPPESRILSVAQAYAAMVLDQPRRPGMSYEQARNELNAGVDTQFDGDVVRALLRILETENEGYRRADDHRFIPPVPETWDRPEPNLREPDDAPSEGELWNRTPKR